MRSCIVISRRERIMRMWGLLGGASAVRRCWLISWIHFSRIWRKSSLGTNCEGVHVCTCVEGYASTHTRCAYVREFEVSPPIGLQRSSQITGRATNYLWSCGPMVPWSRGSMVLWSHSPVVPWSHGPVVPWSRGPMVPWSRGPMVPWSLLIL